MNDKHNGDTIAEQCPYCERGEVGEDLCQQMEVAFGEKDALYMDASIWPIWTIRTKPHISVGVCLFGRDIMTARFPVNYCPMCGRKLMGG